MAEASGTPAAGPRRGAVRKAACDQCRARKIRCDKQTPCSNCRTAQRECSSTGLGQKPRVARQRVLISRQYENKIDHFEARLASMEDMLRNLTMYLSNRGAVASTSTSMNATSSTYSSASILESNTAYDEEPQPDEGNDQAFEGNSSMAAHAEYASTFVANTPLDQQLSPDMRNALASLQQMVHRKGLPQESRFKHQKRLPKGGLKQLPLPPTDVVLRLLREIKAAPLMTFMLSCTFISTQDFIEYCRKVFFATEDYSIALFIIVNTGLYHLFETKSVTEDPRREEYLKYRCLCRDNLETALANLPLLLPPKREMVEALLLGATYSIESSKFTLAWQLNSAAAVMCQTLGWHRIQAQDDKANDRNPASFWFCYMMDKGLSLHFGRTSIMRDLDISVPRDFGDVHERSLNSMNSLWLQTGSIMGEVYDDLYSPAALARQLEQRIETARLLVEKMKRIGEELEEISTTMARGSKVEGAIGNGQGKRSRPMTMDVIYKSGQVSHLALMTLIYRAIPSVPGFSSAFNADCIEAARMAFKSHEERMELTSNNLSDKAGYLHWMILYAPFTPLIVLFCHTIETSNIEDLHRLEKFAASLEPVRSMSQGIEKLHRLCRVLHQVAALHVEAKTQEHQDQDTSMVENDMDMYLSQLGFIPQQRLGESEAAGNLALPLGDWFSGNTYIMGLMEDDLLDFDPGVWSSTMEQ